MSLQGTSESMEQSVSGTVRYSDSSSSISRKALIVFGSLIVTLMLTTYLVTDVYSRSTHLKSADGRWFWHSVFVASIGVCLIFVGVYPRSFSTILRKRVMTLVVLTLTALAMTAHGYYRSAHLGGVDWVGFWGYVVIAGVWFIYSVVKVFRTTPKL